MTKIWNYYEEENVHYINYNEWVGIKCVPFKENNVFYWVDVNYSLEYIQVRTLNMWYWSLFCRQNFLSLDFVRWLINIQQKLHFKILVIFKFKVQPIFICYHHACINAGHTFNRKLIRHALLTDKTYATLRRTL